jgi:hypothetical protein
VDIGRAHPTAGGLNKFGQYVTEATLQRRFSEIYIQAAKQRIELVVDAALLSSRSKLGVFWAYLILAFFDTRKDTRREKCKDGRTNAGYAAVRHQHRSAQNVGINLVQHRIILRNSTPVYYATDRGTMFAQPI